MTRILTLGGLPIDIRDLASQGTALLGIRDSGKSYAGTFLAEQYLEAGIPFVAFDPIGIWRWLRVPGSGKSAKGYPVVVAGGEAGDLPLKVATAREIVRAAMAEGVSLVIDLYDMQLSKSDWKRIVTDCVKELLYNNKKHGLRHIFIEEAAEFAPQRVGPDSGQVYAEIEKLARMGGNALLGYTLINQRSEEVNKAVLELCDNLLLFRQKGRNSLAAINKWLTYSAAEDGTIAGTLPTMPQGECWIWAAGSDRPVRAKIPAKRSFHPDRRAAKAGPVAIKQAGVDVSSFVGRMGESLKTITAEAEANDPKKLKAEIQRLTKELEQAKKATGASPAELQAAEQRGAERGKAEGYATAAQDVANDLEHLVRKYRSWAQQETDLAAKLPKSTNPATAPVKAPAAPRATVSVAAAKPPAEGLTGAQQKVINAIAWWRKIGKHPIERARACVVAGFSPKASTFGVYIAELTRKGLVSVPLPGKVQLTDEGLALAVTPKASTAEDLRDMARGLLAPQEARVFDVVYGAYPAEINRKAVAESVGLSPTASTAGVYISAVAAYGIIEASSPGHVRAADWLFP